jgi:hypothetical protein
MPVERSIPGIADAETQARFAEFYAQQGDEIAPHRLDSAHLLCVFKGSKGDLARLYHEDTGSTDAGIEFSGRKLAQFYPKLDLPQLSIIRTAEQRLTLSTALNHKISLHGELPGVYFYACFDRLSDKLDHFRLEVGNAYMDTSIISKIPREKANPAAFLKSQGIVVDEDSGTTQLTLDGVVATVKNRLPLEDILLRLFPEELRSDPYGAGVEHDGWARSNWMEDFGITVQRVEASEPTTTAS